jgi:two-component system cell cycle sensor histidine kinase/response regulator CckA
MIDERRKTESLPAGPDPRKTILVVDDEAAILGAISAFLSNRTYNLLTANGGEQAFQQSRQYKDEIHLLLSDVQMPGITGVDLAIQVSLQRPQIKVLLMSGFSGGTPGLREGWHFLAKPFTPSQLRDVIARVLAN